MAFDDFVMEHNLVSCLRTNEVDRDYSATEEDSLLQMREEEKLLKMLTLRFLKTAVTPPRHSCNKRVTMQNSSSHLLPRSAKAECVGRGGKNTEDRWR